MNDVAIIDFHGDGIPTMLIDGKPHVFLKPLCAAIGIDWAGQLRRVKNHPVLETCMVFKSIQIPGDDQAREHALFPVSHLDGFLITINASRAHPRVREKLIAYQHESVDVLFQYWRYGIAINPRAVQTVELLTAPVPVPHRRGERFRMEREAFEAREGLKLVSVLKGCGLLSPPKLRSIERDDTKIPEKLYVALDSLGFDMKFIRYGEPRLSIAERALCAAWMVADPQTRAAMLSVAAISLPRLA